MGNDFYQRTMALKKALERMPGTVRDISKLIHAYDNQADSIVNEGLIWRRELGGGTNRIHLSARRTMIKEFGNKYWDLVLYQEMRDITPEDLRVLDKAQGLPGYFHEPKYFQLRDLLCQFVGMEKQLEHCRSGIEKYQPPTVAIALWTGQGFCMLREDVIKDRPYEKEYPTHWDGGLGDLVQVSLGPTNPMEVFLPHSGKVEGKYEFYAVDFSGTDSHAARPILPNDGLRYIQAPARFDLTSPI